jgi:hypothetical protein
MRNLCIHILIVTGLFMSGGCAKDTSVEAPGYRLRIQVIPVVNGNRLVRDAGQTNSWGEDFRVDVFRIYLGNFSLLNDGDVPVSDHPDAYHLIDVFDSSSLSIDLTGNERPFRRLRFQIGIDSIRNVSGAQTGALDPLNGMFWTWQTGYIHAKFEGSSAASLRPDNRFTYHIGGFQKEQDTKRIILLDLPGQNAWTLDKSGLTHIILHMDLDAWFKAVHDLPISGQAQVMQPGPLAVEYADNYPKMFSLENIERR